MEGGAATVALMDQGKEISGGALIELIFGSTEPGLRTFMGSAGPMLEVRLGVVRLGVGCRVGVFDVARVTSQGSLTSATLGAFLRLTLDLVQFGDEKRNAVFLAFKASGDTVGDLLAGATLSAGARF